METPVKYKAKKTVKKSTTKKKLVYEMFFSYVDNNNKIQNALADVNYPIDSRERMWNAQNDIKKFANGNFRCLISYQVLRKKYVTENKEETK